MAKLTLISESVPQYLYVGEHPSENTLIEKDFTIEINPKRALSFIKCADFRVEFEPGELDSFDDKSLETSARVLGLSNAKKVRATLAPSAKKNIVQRVVNATTTPTPTEDEKSETVETSEDADSADDSD